MYTFIMVNDNIIGVTRDSDGVEIIFTSEENLTPEYLEYTTYINTTMENAVEVDFANNLAVMKADINPPT